MSTGLFVEVRTEELPAGVIEAARTALGEGIARALADAGIARGAVRTWGTPRRLAAAVADVAARAADRTETVQGPPVEQAYHADGSPTPVLTGFAAARGIDLAAVYVVETTKKNKAQRVVAADRTIAGRTAYDVLLEAIPRVLGGLPFPKSMKWGPAGARFSRPVRGLCGLLDGAVLPFVYADLTADDRSAGHRFLAPEPFVVTDADQWCRELAARYVLADGAERQARIRAETARIAATYGGRADDEALVAETANLVEYPFALAAAFDERFSALPPAVAVGTMRKNQRYFPIFDAAGALTNRFVVIAGNKPLDPAVVAEGNARVVRARLADAQFVVQEDAARPLEAFAAELGRVTYHRLLGTVGDKIERIRALAAELAAAAGVSDATLLDRAARLAKADLATRAVYEFPELQGVMGAWYARAQGEPAAVVEAIETHWQPRFAGDAVPSGASARAIALADKLDTLVSGFAAGLAPTGTKDPYALRRTTLGLIAILESLPTDPPIADVVRRASARVPERAFAETKQTPAAVAEAVETYIWTRFSVNADERGTPADITAAARAAGFAAVQDAHKRLAALTAFARGPGYEAAATAFKRAANIVAKQGAEWTAAGAPAPDATRIAHPAERALYEALTAVRAEVQAHVTTGRYDEALAALGGLAEPVTAFFDGVRVLDDDGAVRVNRLALLAAVRDTTAPLADFTKIAAG